MKETGILMNGEMVKAIQELRKTQTRRVIKLNNSGRVQHKGKQWHVGDPNVILACPYGQVGDRLYVKETFALLIPAGASIRAERIPHYRADGGYAPRWTPSIHMPRWASRITLEITGVKVERIASISADDAIQEGINLELCRDWHGENCFPDGEAAIDAFQDLWDSINARRGYSWESNPWNWALTFKMA